MPPASSAATFPGAPFDCSELALIALGLAQTETRAGSGMLDQGKQFSSLAEQLANIPEFDVVTADAAAEFLKTKSTHEDQTWARFGLRSGTYLALLPLMLIYFTAKDTNQQVVAVVGLLLAIATFISGMIGDTMQLQLKNAEALLKAAAKLKPQLVNAGRATSAPVGIDVKAVAQKLEGQRRIMMTLAITALVGFLIMTLLILFLLKPASAQPG